MSKFYTESHEWVSIENGIATIGISDFAQSELGDITFVDLPSVGTKITKGKDFAAVESVKAASDIYAPIDCEITEVNTALDANPEILNSSALTDGWLVKAKTSSDTSGLMSEADYNAKYPRA